MNLTKSEFRVAKLAVQGLSTAEIAKRLFVTEGCIKSHLGLVYKKTQCKGRYELISRYGLVFREEEVPVTSPEPLKPPVDQIPILQPTQMHKYAEESIALPRGTYEP